MNVSVKIRRFDRTEQKKGEIVFLSANLPDDIAALLDDLTKKPVYQMGRKQVWPSNIAQKLEK